MFSMSTVLIAALAMNQPQPAPAASETPSALSAAAPAAMPVSEPAPASISEPAPAPALPLAAVGVAGARRIAAGTDVLLETLQPLSSATLKRGDKFGLRLAQALSVDGAPVLPAGTTGVGEVIHAERSRSGGKPGELLLAARYLEADGRQIPLRSFRVGAAGVDKSGKVIGLAASLSAAVGVFGVFAMFMRGGEIEIPAHTQAQARTAQDVDLTPAAATPVQTPLPAVTTEPPVTTQTGEVVQ
ncbi:hypothetical protein [Lysobacter antibioticus]|uniref:Uncharacterized protein n=1 Tax=Lysobacter antibioticus TaxID=84531 RepID=A0A0S2FE01_LYSAN|nr:hypothetical protein [Lysobacter antibioticus]ALN81768.1 hypothetical protein LA76x_3646 [Lysobacter antibioticus]